MTIAPTTTDALATVVRVSGDGTLLFLPVGASLSADLLDVVWGGNMTSLGSVTVPTVRISGGGSVMKCVLTTDLQFETMHVLDGNVHSSTHTCLCMCVCPCTNACVRFSSVRMCM